jgi:hypothetical protein
MRKFSKRSMAITAAAVVAVGAGGAAFAAATGWDIGGTGTADASTSTIVNMTATADMGTNKVYPGLVTTVNTAITNLNDFPVNLNTTAITPTGVQVTVGAGAAACQTALMGAPSTLTATFPATTIGAGATGQVVAASVAIANTLPQSCAGSHIKLFYSFGGVSTV